MATLTVTNTNDAGTGSLRAQIAAAAATDTIKFDPTLAGQTIVLTSGFLALTKDVVIDGDINGDDKADITISGDKNGNGLADAGDSGILVISGAGTDVDLLSLTLTNGFFPTPANGYEGGGAVLLVSSGGTLDVVNSTISNSVGSYGGAMDLVGGSTRVINSTLANNTAAHGGGIYVGGGGSLAVINTTLTGNHATINGGAIEADGSYGAVTVVVQNSTIASNIANNAIGSNAIRFADGASLTITNSVVAQDAGVNGGLFLTNNIGSNSLTVNSSAFTEAIGSLVTGGNTLRLEDANLKLGALADHGGTVMTRDIPQGSDLRGLGSSGLLPNSDPFDLDHDTITAEALPTDTNGRPRVVGTLDLGAAEFKGPVVTSSADLANDIGASFAADIADNGGLTLREAINWAAAGETITFAPGIGLITLNGTSLNLSKNLAIDGDVNGDDKADITISGNNASSILQIFNNASVDLFSLNLTGGRSDFGGAIKASAGTTLDVVNSAIFGNTATSDGGGLNIAGTATLTNSTISGNSGRTGGGVLVDGSASLTVVNSTISGNQANVADQAGGGIQAGPNAILVIQDSTITANNALRGGGLSLGSNVVATITNSIVAGNTATTGANADVDEKFNPATINATNSFFGSSVGLSIDSGAANKFGNADGALLLSALADNGGTVKTHAIQAGSPLISAGNAASRPVDTFDLDRDGNITELLPTDATGQARVSGGGMDIGAVEFTGLVVTRDTDMAGVNDTVGASLAVDIADGGLSLREAIAWSAVGETVRFASNVSTIVLTQGELQLTKDITIDGDRTGDRKADVTISGNNANRIFFITGSSTDASLASLTLVNGVRAVGLYDGNLTLSDSTISHSTGSRAPLFVVGTGLAKVFNTTFSDNHTTSRGGAIELQTGGSATLMNSTLVGNSTTLYGGAIGTFQSTTLKIYNSTIAGNTAGVTGNALSFYAGATVTISNSVVTQSAGASGAFVYDGGGGGNTIIANNSFFSGAITVDGGSANTISGGDAKLGKLADHGGPVMTYSLQPDSPLRNAGGPLVLDQFDIDRDGNTSEVLPTDGRGLARISGTRPDIGAFELAPTIKDLNGDGFGDVLWQNKATGQTATWLMDASNILQGTYLPTVPGWHIKESADFNGDHKGDILLQNDNGQIAMWMMNGPTITGGGALPINVSGWDAGNAADFNGDGRADILLQNDNGQIAMWIMNGSTVTSTGLVGGPIPDWTVKDAADFNGDGRADVLMRSDAGQVGIWLMNGTQIMQAFPIQAILPDWTPQKAADFNGDGKADILMQQNDGLIAMWLMDGGTLIQGTVVAPTPQGWHVLDARDLNGDGKADLLFQADSGLAAVWYMDGPTLIRGEYLSNLGADWMIV